MVQSVSRRCLWRQLKKQTGLYRVRLKQVPRRKLEFLINDLTFLNEIFSRYSHDLSAFIWQISPTLANLCRNGVENLSKEYVNGIFNHAIFRRGSPVFLAASCKSQSVRLQRKRRRRRRCHWSYELEIPEIYNNDDKTTATAIRYVTLHGYWQCPMEKHVHKPGSLITRHKKYNKRAQLLLRWPRNVTQVE